MIHLVEVVVIVGGVVLVTFLILLSLPTFKLRDIIMALIIATLSPDDEAAVVMGIRAAMKTIRANRQKRSYLRDPYFN